MKKENSIDAFLFLVRKGIGHSSPETINISDWYSVRNIANEHGLTAVVLDGVGKLPETNRPPQEFILEWIGEVLQDYEYRYVQYKEAISELASFYNSHGFKMMLLKGYACSLDWPKPEHRPCGDIDIWQFGKQKEADAILEKEKPVQVVQGGQKFKIDKSHHHHTVFNWGEFTVENHYDFLNVYHHKSNVELEVILKELGRDERHFIGLKKTSTGARTMVYLPSPNLHALFLLRHSMSNFASTGLKIRQLLDWAFFVEAHGSEVDWKWLNGILEKFGMKPLFQIFNAICVEDFGFSSNLFPTIQFRPFDKDKVWKEILSREFPLYQEGSFLKRAFFKYRRWKGSGWKHELCFNESLRCAFWSGIWSHLIKPSSI